MLEGRGGGGGGRRQRSRERAATRDKKRAHVQGATVDRKVGRFAFHLGGQETLDALPHKPEKGGGVDHVDDATAARIVIAVDLRELPQEPTREKKKNIRRA